MTGQEPSDDDLRSMLEARADRVAAADTRTVLEGVRSRVAGSAGERGGRAFGLQPVNARRHRTLVPWQAAAVALAAVLIVALVGSRFDLGRPIPTVIVGASPSGGVASIAVPIATASVEPVVHVARDQLGAALDSGALDGKLVLMDGRLRIELGFCVASSDPDACTWLRLDDPHAALVKKGALSRSEAEAGVARHPGTSTIALLVKERTATLVGWVLAGVPDPVGVAWLLQRDAPLAAGDVAIVGGWVIGGTATTGPWLTEAGPLSDGTRPPGIAIEGDVVSTLHLGAAPDAMRGPFIVREAAPGSRPGVKYEIAGLYTDVVRVDPATTPATPSPGAAALPPVTCGRPTTWDRTDAHGSPIPILLTCENAVAAAEAFLGADPDIVSVEFGYRWWCPRDRLCAASLPNGGHVIFHLGGRKPDVVVSVSADAAGRVTAYGPEELPSPNP
jgi:hypothetical protein